MVEHVLLVAKTKGIICALSKMSAKERELPPSGTYARDYNKIRSQVIETHPCLKDVIPPEVEIMSPVMGQEIGKTRYVEIHSYFEAINELLKTT